MNKLAASGQIVAGKTLGKTDAKFAELKQRVKAAGLLEKQPKYVAFKIIMTLSLFAISLIVLFATDNLWIQLLNAIYLGFVFGQFGFVIHDVGHRQAFRTARQNDVIGFLFGDLLMGMSFAWWVGKHNEHHAHPNQHDLDPDIDIPMLAFSKEDALSKKGVMRWIVKYQAYFLLPMLSLNAFNLRFKTFEYLTTNQYNKRWLEMLLIFLHFVWFWGVLYVALPLPMAIMVFVVQQGVWGWYLSSVFAPNHKGMPVFDDGDIDYVRLQVLTSRNIRNHPLTNFIYGGLNFQVEHHLFPSMGENKLPAAQNIVREFCAEHNIEYYETGFIRSYVEILQYLHMVGEPLRATVPTASPTI